MWVSQLTEDMLTPQLIDRLLFDGLDDPGGNADCIMVLGSAKAATYRVPTAVQAYQTGRAPLLLLCGGKLQGPDGDTPEALLMRDRALALGVPECDVLLEDRSQNTVENILCGMLAMQRRLWLNNVHRLLLVTAAFHMRRSLCIARYLLPEHITVLPCPANDNDTRRDTWMTNEHGMQRVRAEAMNLALYARKGVFPDFEV